MRLDKLYAARFNPEEQEKKERVWQVLCKSFFQRYIEPTDVLLELGSGYCEFINNIRCKRKLAVDLNEETLRYANSDVEVIKARSVEISSVVECPVDVVFASNFFEHLRNKEELMATLEEIRRVLRPGGKLLVLQPNIRFLQGEYWDFLDHHLPLTERTLLEALMLAGFQPQEVKAKFLPYTTKSRFPKWPWVVRLYLLFPLAHRFFGKQSWVVATKA